MEFTAVIKQHEGIDGAYVEMPFDLEQVFGMKRMKVKATFDGAEYRGSVVSMGGCYVLGITKDMRNKIQKQFGDDVHVTLERDMEERKVEIPEDLAEAMVGNDQAKAVFQALSFTAQKEYITWITSAKKSETRTGRIEKAMALLSEGKKLK